MANPYFAFKQFTIHQDKCAMKVGTDAVLLGAWVNTAQPERILDIGTGTGVIALMMAQKFDAQVDAIDIDLNAFDQALENARKSPWKERLHILHQSLQEFCQSNPYQYDLIVSNPPYFVDSFKAAEESRNAARHTDQLPFSELIEGVLYLLKPGGKFCLIMPVKEGQRFREIAGQNGLYLTKLTLVKTKPEKAEKRLLMQFEKKPGRLEENILVLEQGERHSPTAEYIALTKDFYLNF